MLFFKCAPTASVAGTGCRRNTGNGAKGVRKFRAAHPDVPLFTASIDSHLNENGYIVPGLGDAGDRLYGTK